MAADPAEYDDQCEGSGRCRTQIEDHTAYGEHKDRIRQKTDDHIDRILECLSCAAYEM